MKRKLDCILLVDDNYDDNYFHQRTITKMNIANSVQIVENGLEAIEFLRKDGQIIPELIFLDINMPKMNGWEFLEQYKHLEARQKARIIIMVLTTSENPDDLIKAKEIQEISGFKTKPLTEELLIEILDRHFGDYK